MTGISIPFKGIFDEEAMKGFIPALTRAKDLGAESVEIRNVKPGYDPAEVGKIAAFITGLGFRISVHGAMESPETAVEDVFAPLSEVLPGLKQKSLNITVHPFDGDNPSALTNLSDYITENGLPVTIALENKRLMPDGTQGDCAEYVLEAVKKTDRPNVGICFDLGHYLYFVLKNHPEKPDMLPSSEFYSRVIHTHIHALRGHSTHFPLTAEYDMPLREYLAPLAPSFSGIFNLELSFHKFADLLSPADALAASLDSLRAAIPKVLAEHDRLRREFDGDFRSALTVFDRKEGLSVSLAGPTFYLFSFGGYRIAVDPAFRVARRLADTPAKAGELLQDADLVVITHAHKDHFEESTVRLTSGNRAKWIIPDFLAEKALSYGLPEEKMMIAEKGKPLAAGPLTVLPLEGRHFRPDTGKGVPEYGYFITREGLPSVVVPGDTRDYSALPEVPPADVCFLHVWLGDGLEDAETHPLARDAARFALRFSEKCVILAHLYESGRKDGRMWTRAHAEEIAREIASLSSATRVMIPRQGEVIPMSCD